MCKGSFHNLDLIFNKSKAPQAHYFCWHQAPDDRHDNLFFLKYKLGRKMQPH